MASRSSAARLDRHSNGARLHGADPCSGCGDLKSRADRSFSVPTSSDGGCACSRIKSASLWLQDREQPWCKPPLMSPVKRGAPASACLCTLSRSEPQTRDRCCAAIVWVASFTRKSAGQHNAGFELANGIRPELLAAGHGRMATQRSPDRPRLHALTRDHPTGTELTPGALPHTAVSPMRT